MKVPGIAFLLFTAAMAHPSDPEPGLPKGVSFGFDISKRYESNQIVVVLKAEGKASTLAGAMQKANTLSAKVVDRLVKAGTRKEEILMMKGGSFPSKYGFFGKVKEYECRAELEIKSRKFEVVNSISGLLSEDEDLTIASIKYAHDNADSLKKAFTAEAMRKIVEAKANYETSLGAAYKICAVAEAAQGAGEAFEYERGYGSKSISKREAGFEGFSSTPNLEYSAHYNVQLCP